MTASRREAIKIEDVEAKWTVETRKEVEEQIANGAAVICPCCGQYASMNERQITSTMAEQLLRMYRANKPMESKQIQIGSDGAGRLYSLLRFWGLIEKRESSWWCITERGRLFVEERITVPRIAFVYNNSLVRLSEGDDIHFRDCFAIKEPKR